MYSKTILCTFLASTLLSWARADESPFEWLNWFESTNANCSDIETDSAGNVYVVGTYTGSLKVGKRRLPFAETADIFIAKFTPRGKPIWTERLDSGGEDAAGRFIVERNGTIFLCGWWDTSALIHKTPVQRGPFVARLDHGRLSWSDIFAPENDGGGVAELTLSLKDRSLWVIGAKQGRILIKSYAQNGRVINERFANEDYGASPADIAVGVDGHVFITGTFWRVVTFGTTNTFNGGNGYQFTAAFDANGKTLWLWIAPAEAVLGGSPNAAGTAIEAVRDGGVISAGMVRKTTFGLPYAHAFVSKHAADGTLLWMQMCGEHRGGYWALDVAADAQGNTVMTGYANGYAYDPASRTGLMIVGYDVNGDQHFEHRVNSVERSDPNIGTGVCIDARGNAYITGVLTGSPIIGTNVLPWRASSPFVARVHRP